MSLFETGTIVNTIGIRDMMMGSADAAETIRKCLDRHCRGDWGDLCDEDKQMNNDALEAER